MNEQANVDLIKKLYAAFAAGDIQTIINHLDAGVEWRCEGPSVVPYCGHFQGPDNVLKFFAALASTQAGMKLTTDEYIAQDDKVVTVGRYSANVPATGKTLDSAITHIFTIRDGRVTRFHDFADTAQMADAYCSA